MTPVMTLGETMALLNSAASQLSTSDIDESHALGKTGPRTAVVKLGAASAGDSAAPPGSCRKPLSGVNVENGRENVPCCYV
ncbi:hypothetical protein [Saccharopolyspora spinosa]|uniref:Uncharacterized protein n=1 Tax=Saccharopolyspora spinosa TaxID=60894 RepID=A0A2N3Y5W3_SACSN|nr:hypothetical protein [Saccharopolyspora spinosa]PKW18273.1 hypothetical protein A8926_6344 [Saccharopolyspora spinosa]